MHNRTCSLKFAIQSMYKCHLWHFCLQPGPTALLTKLLNGALPTLKLAYGMPQPNQTRFNLPDLPDDESS